MADSSDTATPESGAFGAIRSIFRRASQQQEPEGHAEGAPHRFQPPEFTGKRIVVRNCSTNEMMARLTAALGAKHLEGRYFEPAEQDFHVVFDTAKSMGLYVRWTEIDDLLILDMMADRERLGNGFRGERRPSYRGPWREPRGE